MHPAPLFRPEAVEARYKNQFGPPLRLQGFSLWVVSWAIIVSSFLLVGFLSFASYARKETVIGFLEPIGGIAQVHAPRAGTIKRLEVKDGQKIEGGVSLLTIEADQTSETGSNIDAEMIRLLMAQSERLREQMKRQTGWAQIERTRIGARLAGVEKEQVELKTQLALQVERASLAERRVTTLKDVVDKGFVARAEFDRWIETHLSSRQSAAALQQQIVTLEAKRQEDQYALDQLPTTSEGQMRTLSAELAGLEQRIAEIEGRRAYTIRAPAAGRVSSLQASPGRWVTPTQPLLAIVPTASELRAQLLVPTRAIGFVRSGQAVRILYDAFPYQRFGAQTGHVVEVSRTVFVASDFSGPVHLNEPAYRVTVALARQTIDVADEPHPLQAGMQLRANIILDSRPLWQWALDPILRVRL